MKNTALYVAGAIFLVVGALHGARLVAGAEVTVMQYAVPMVVSMFGCVVSLALGVWMLYAARVK